MVKTFFPYITSTIVLLLTPLLVASFSNSVQCSSNTAVKSTLTFPSIHYTVPGMKLAYQDEKTKTWYNNDGVSLDGPPRNYWRQSLDERLHLNDLELVETAIKYGKLNDVLKERISLTESSKGGVSYPWSSRKLLGTWTPILHDGQVVVSQKNHPHENQKLTIEASTLIDIQRPDGPKYGPKNNYGLFYAALKNDEEFRVKSRDGMFDTVLRASRDKNRAEILFNSENSLFGVLQSPVYLGKITYLSDYVLIQHRPNSNNSVDIWLRVDDSYLGFNPDILTE